MQRAYLVVLVIAAVAALGLVIAALARPSTGAPQTGGRRLNEWTWTLIPLTVLGFLLWHALK